MGALGADDLQRRVLLTLALLAAYVATHWVPSLGIDLTYTPEFADKTGAFALGIRPALSAYMVVEFFAWVVPRWRKLRASNQGRDVLERMSAIIAIIYATFQGFGIAKMLQGFDDEFGTRGFMTPTVESPALLMLSMVVGAGVTLAIARFITRLGLLNGFVALTLVELGMLIASRRDVTTDASDTFVDVLQAPLVVAAALVLPVVATLLLIATPPKPGAEVDIPPPGSSLEPVAAAGAIIAIPMAVFGDASFWSFLEGIPEWRLWLQLSVAAVVGLSLCALFTLPDPFASVLANTGMRPARATRMAQTAASRALLPAALFVVVLAACDYTAEKWLGLQLLAVDVALATALVVDAREALVVHGLGGWVRVLRDPRPQLVAVAARQLLSKGIEARIGTRAQSGLLRSFGAYACSEILVQKGDSERASEVVGQLFTGPPKTDASLNADASPDTDAPTDADASADTDAPANADAPPGTDAAPNADVSTNAFAPPTVDEHEHRPVFSTLELRLAILALAAIVAPALAD